MPSLMIDRARCGWLRFSVGGNGGESNFFKRVPALHLVVFDIPSVCNYTLVALYMHLGYCANRYRPVCA